ncbi:choline transporter-like protein 1 [Neocloeon triangulifer]|uniref:choline transporter-like protein 1 n=1 Tax=Neocloeon triangulifer TaxID=2078957 RepID=UPI00286F5AA6|nr:choline transporter-like protein 1 [Neocloeon triangulifer]
MSLHAGKDANRVFIRSSPIFQTRMGAFASKRKDKVEPEPPPVEDKEKPKEIEISETPFPKKRVCTDVICLMFLAIFTVVLIGLLVYCFKYGDINRIVNGYDRCGNVCGQVTERIGIAPEDPKYTCLGADMTKKKYLLVTGAGLRQTNEFNVNRECVNSCQYYPGYRQFLNRCIPIKDAQRESQRQYSQGSYSSRIGSASGASSNWAFNPGSPHGLTRQQQVLRQQQLQSAKSQNNIIRAQLPKPELILVKNYAKQQILVPLPDGRIKRSSVLGRKLLQYRGQRPLDPAERINVYFSKTGIQNFFQEVAEDLQMCWREMLALFFVALGFALVMMLLLIVAVKVVVVMSLVAAIVVCTVATAYLWAQWAYEKDKLTETYKYYPNSMSQVEMTNVNSYMGYAIAASVVSGILFLVLLVTRKRIGLVIRLFEEAGKAVSQMPTLLILPWITFAIIGVLIGGWFYLALWIESSGRLTSENNVNFIYEKDGPVVVARWWNLLALFWLVQFVMACQHLTVAGAVGNWYFTRKKESLKHPVDRSIARTVSYHLGSAAFGAALVGIFQFVRAVWQEFFRLMKPTAAEQLTLTEGAQVSPPVEQAASTKLINCLMYPFTKFLAFINRNAYIEVALRGCNFIEGGRRAIKMIVKHALSIAAINSVGDFVLFLAKIAVMLSTMLVAIAMIQNKEGVLNMWVPITLASLFGYIVAHIFLTVYEMTIDTIFICFCEDCEMNDNVDRPFFMSEGLMEFIDDCDAPMRERLMVKDGQVFTIESPKK